MKRIPIPQVSVTTQKSIIQLFDEILSTIASNWDADVSELEAEINRQLYELYELTPTEIYFIENVV